MSGDTLNLLCAFAIVFVVAFVLGACLTRVFILGFEPKSEPQIEEYGGISAPIMAKKQAKIIARTDAEELLIEESKKAEKGWD